MSNRDVLPTDANQAPPPIAANDAIPSQAARRNQPAGSNAASVTNSDSLPNVPQPNRDAVPSNVPPSTDVETSSYSEGLTRPKSRKAETPFSIPDFTASTKSPGVNVPPGELQVQEIDDDETPISQDAIRNAPPWLVSLVFHMAMMILLGFLVLPRIVKNSIEIDGSFSDKFGEQLQEDVAMFTLEPSPLQESLITPDDLTVEDPLVLPDKLTVSDVGMTTPSEFESQNIGIALSGRTPGMKSVLLAAYGGNETTQEAVLAGLNWLKRNQRNDGTWSLRGPYSSGALSDDVTSATAMALLAFQGAGHTHQNGEFKDVVQKGWRAMLKMQKSNGDFWQGEVRHHRLYSQAQASIAVCELYGMTKDSAFRLPAQKAIEYAVKNQDRAGGWRYEPGRESDTSVTGWFVMALQSARMAGLEVPTTTWKGVAKYLDSAAHDGGATYSYLPENEATYSMTAEGLLCRQYLGWKRDDERLQTGLRYLTALPIDWEDKNVYYWYYATQVMHHMGDDLWDEWNRKMRVELPRRQTKDGAERGSWSPTGDQWAAQGGRLYTTCLCIYMLEVYYRHLPIYESVY